MQTLLMCMLLSYYKRKVFVEGKISVGKIKGSLLLHALRHSLLSASGRYFLQAGCPAKLFIFMLLSFIDPPRACDAHCHFVISRTRLAIAAGLVSVGLFSCPEVCGRDSMKSCNEKLRSPSNHHSFFFSFLNFPQTIHTMACTVVLSCGLCCFRITARPSFC